MLDRVRAVYVTTKRELYEYVLVTDGERRDINLAYDLRIIPMDSPPSMISTDAGNITVEVVADLVELDKVRAQLGLYRPTLITRALNAAWRKLDADTKPRAGGDGITMRVYRVDHPDHRGGFF